MESNTQPAGGDYPVNFTVEYPDRDLNRLTTGFRLIVAIPILILAASIGHGEASWGSAGHVTTIALGSGGGLLTFPPLLMIVFRQEYPRWRVDWNLQLV